MLSKKTTVLLALTGIVIVSCAKAPMTEHVNAKNALKSALSGNAEKCAPKEYSEAMKSFQNAERKLEEAKEYAFAYGMYDDAKKELLNAQQKAAAAEKIAAEKLTESEKLKNDIKGKLQELEIMKADCDKYSKERCDTLTAKYNQALALLDECRVDDAKKLMSEADEECTFVKNGITLAKQKEKEELEKQKAEEAEKLRLAELEKQKADNSTKSTVAADSPAVVMHTVVKKDNLWNISKKYYSNPFLWPLIYWNNKKQIKDPDLIKPKQVFEVKKEYTETEQRKAEKFSKTRGNWSLRDGK